MFLTHKFEYDLVYIYNTLLISHSCYFKEKKKLKECKDITIGLSVWFSGVLVPNFVRHEFFCDRNGPPKYSCFFQLEIALFKR